MKLEPRILNCLWLIIPLLIWNIIFGPDITNEKILSDANSPQWLLVAENISRIFVFGLPLFIPLLWQTKNQKVGMTVFITGTLIYFASWLPLLISPESSWSNSTAGLLAPRLTPLLPFVGIAIIGNSWTYVAASGFFIFFHTWHGFQNL